MTAKRNWQAAAEKVAAEGACRRCGRSGELDLAHVIARSRLTASEGAEDPRNIIGLCRRCHDAQHNLEFELLPLLTREEELYVVGLVGLGEAYRRLTLRAVSP